MGIQGNWKRHKYLACHDALVCKPEEASFEAYMYHHMSSAGPIVTDFFPFWIDKLVIFSFQLFSKSLLSFKQSRFGCQQRQQQWLLLLSKSLFSKRATAKHITSVGLCFRVPNRSDKKKKNIADAWLLLCCLGAQQVKTPQCHSSRLFSCYTHILTYPQLCTQHCDL